MEKPFRPQDGTKPHKSCGVPFHCYHNRWRVLRMLLIWTCSVLSVIVDAHRFKRAPSSIVYWAFSDIHKNKIKKGLCNITSLTPKCSYLRFFKVQNIWITFLHGVQKNGRKFKIIKFFWFEGNTQLLKLWYISLHSQLFLKIINFAWDCINVFLLEILLGDHYAIVLEMLCHYESLGEHQAKNVNTLIS
jgi:hypothetical protein